MFVFEKKLQELVALNQVSVTKEALSLLEGYFRLSVHWGEKINITNNLKVDDYILENILDPIIALQGTKKSLVEAMPGVVTDLGCGGGYVGLTWAIVEPQLKVHLVDADRKKINFCKQVIRESELSGRVSAEQARVEDLRGLSGVICSRATWGADRFFQHLKSIAVTGTIGTYLGGFDELQTDAEQSIVSYQIEPAIKRRAVFVRKN